MVSSWLCSGEEVEPHLDLDEAELSEEDGLEDLAKDDCVEQGLVPQDLASTGYVSRETANDGPRRRTGGRRRTIMQALLLDR